MKKVINTIVFLIVAQFGAQAQISDSKSKDKIANHWQVGVLGGIAIPNGTITQTDYADAKSGFSGLGNLLGVSGSYMLNKHLSLTAMIAYQGYSFNGVQNLATGYKDDFGVDSCTVTLKGRNYAINFMAGATWSVPLASKLHADFRLMVGVSSAHLAGHSVYLEDNEAGAFSQSSATAIAIAAQGGVGVRYDIGKQFGVSLNGDYFYSKPGFEITNTNRANNAGRVITQYNQPWTGINTAICLYYRF